MTTTNTIARCPRCGRALRATRSLKAGYGPICTRRIRQATRDQVVAQCKPTQVTKAQ